MIKKFMIIPKGKLCNNCETVWNTIPNKNYVGFEDGLHYFNCTCKSTLVLPEFKIKIMEI